MFEKEIKINPLMGLKSCSVVPYVKIMSVGQGYSLYDLGSNYVTSQKINGWEAGHHGDFKS